MNLVGIDIGGTKCAVSTFEPDGSVMERARFATAGPRETVAQLIEVVKRLDLPRGNGMLFGISCGGPLDAQRGLILSPPNLPGWDGIAICEAFTARFGGRAYLMNDANACALAEWQFGAGRGCQSMIFLTAGTGMGAGLILNGRLFEGASGNAGEVGHMRLATDGPEGHGKPGSFEGFCGGNGIARFARLRGWPHPDVTAKALADAAVAGNRHAQAIWQEVGTRLGEAMALLIDVLNPERIVLGSIYVRCRALLEPPMRAVIEREALPDSVLCCEILPASLGEEIGNYGAIAVARYKHRNPATISRTSACVNPEEHSH